MATTKIAKLACMLTVLVSCLITTRPTAMAAEEKQRPPIIKASEQHKVLKKEVGAWDAAVKIWPVPGGEPLESTGVEKNHMLKGGLWLITRFDGKAPGMPFTGMGQFGYDPAEKKYVGNWVDTMTPYMMISKSDYDDETKTMSGVSETRDPITGEKYTAKMITRYNDDGTRVMEMHRTGEDGKEWKVMEITYKRRPKKTSEKAR